MGVEDANNNGEENEDGNANNDGGANENKQNQDGGSNEQIANLNTALKQARDEAKAAKEALATKTAAEEQAAREAAEKSGEFERLYGEEKTRADKTGERLTALETKETERLAVVTSDADAVVAKWPEADRALDPTGLDPDARLRMVQQLDARLNPEKRPAGTRSNGTDKDAPVPDWVKANYKQFHAGLDAPNDEKLRAWMGYLKNEPKFAEKFKTNTT